MLLGLGMKKGFRTPPKTLTVEPGIPGVCRYFAVFSVYHDIGCLAAHPALIGPLSRLSFVRIPLFSKKVTMGARSGQSEYQHVLLYEIDQQQVWCDMALPEAGHIACKRMVMISVGQCVPPSDRMDTTCLKRPASSPRRLASLKSFLNLDVVLTVYWMPLMRPSP